MAASAPPPDENSSDIVILEGPETQPSPMELSPELMDEWKHNKATYGRSHFMKYLLTTGKLTDVTFNVKNEDGSVEKIKAHKSILKFKSDFFAALFSDRWSNDEVDLTNSEIKSGDFKAFKEFLYLHHVPLTDDNVMALYVMANMYQIVDLKLQCEQYFRAHVDEENALTLFNAVFLHDTMRSTAALNVLTQFICRNGESMLEKPEMLNLSQSQISWIFANYHLASSPLKVLRFCLRWTVKHFGRKKLHDFAELDDFFRHSLHMYDKVQNIPSLTDLSTSPYGYGMARHVMEPNENASYEFKRFNAVDPTKPWTYRRNRWDRISFRCTESILLTGLGLYGDLRFHDLSRYGKRAWTEEGGQPAKYNIDVRVHLHGKSFKELLNVFRRAGTDMNEDTGIYKIDLQPLFLHSNEWYTISVKIAGPQTYAGCSGVQGSLIRCGNTPVIIEFQEASSKDSEANLSNATGVPIGQIPLLFFKVANGKDDEDEVKVLD